MMNCPQRRAQNPEPGTWNLEPESWNLEPVTCNSELGTWNSELGTFSKQSGFLLVTAIFLLVILAALGAFILTISGTQQTSSALDVQGSRAYQAARAGIDWASYQVLINAGGCAGYIYERSVTINHLKVSNTDQSNFPVLFSGTYSYLATVANGGKVTNASGFDIIFTNSAGAKLDHEIESYNAATGAVNFWVRVPTVSFTTDTVIYLCYGNAAITTSQENKTGVWDTNYKGVWHLKEDPSGAAPQMQDSTATANNGTSNGAMTSGNQVAGKINGSLSLDGTDDRIQVGSIIGNINAFTMSIWFKHTASGAPLKIMAEGNTGTTTPIINLSANEPAVGDVWFEIRDDAGVVAQIIKTGGNNNGAWHHLVGVQVSKSSRLLYVDGVQQGTNTTTVGTITLNTGNIGAINRVVIQYFFPGSVDEARISNIARTADWILTEYNNQNSPSTFYTLGAESAAGSSYATDCNPGPTTQNVTGMGGTLSGFTAAVTCSSTTYTEGAATWTVYQITSTGAQGTAGTLDRVERQLQATLTK